jgi:hypothetical protein
MEYIPGDVKEYFQDSAGKISDATGRWPLPIVLLTSS